MVILVGWVFLMSEAHLYIKDHVRRELPAAHGLDEVHLQRHESE